MLAIRHLSYVSKKLKSMPKSHCIRKLILHPPADAFFCLDPFHFSKFSIELSIFIKWLLSFSEHPPITKIFCRWRRSRRFQATNVAAQTRCSRFRGPNRFVKHSGYKRIANPANAAIDDHDQSEICRCGSDTAFESQEERRLGLIARQMPARERFAKILLDHERPRRQHPLPVRRGNQSFLLRRQIFLARHPEPASALQILRAVLLLEAANRLHLERHEMTRAGTALQLFGLANAT